MLIRQNLIKLSLVRRHISHNYPIKLHLLLQNNSNWLRKNMPLWAFQQQLIPRAVAVQVILILIKILVLAEQNLVSLPTASPIELVLINMAQKAELKQDKAILI